MSQVRSFLVYNERRYDDRGWPRFEDAVTREVLGWMALFENLQQVLLERASNHKIYEYTSSDDMASPVWSKLETSPPAVGAPPNALGGAQRGVLRFLVRARRPSPPEARLPAALLAAKPASRPHASAPTDPTDPRAAASTGSDPRSEPVQLCSESEPAQAETAQGQSEADRDGISARPLSLITTPATPGKPASATRKWRKSGFRRPGQRKYIKDRASLSGSQRIKTSDLVAHHEATKARLRHSTFTGAGDQERVTKLYLDYHRRSAGHGLDPSARPSHSIPPTSNDTHQRHNCDGNYWPLMTTHGSSAKDGQAGAPS